MDYKNLLIKFIEHCKQSETIDFIGQINNGMDSDIVFTQEEQTELRKLEKEGQMLFPYLTRE